jgi:hypothetical protein
MPERRQPEFDPDAAVRAVADEDLPEIETPVINIHDLEPKPQLSARAKDSGVKVLPPMPPEDEQEVRDALAEFEREYEKLRRADS